MTDDKLEAAIARGARAKELLGSELLKEVFAQIESDYIAGWRHTSARDTDARERLWLAVQVLGLVGPSRDRCQRRQACPSRARQTARPRGLGEPS